MCPLISVPWQLVGAGLSVFAVERSRVTAQRPGERNFNVFYQVHLRNLLVLLFDCFIRIFAYNELAQPALGSKGPCPPRSFTVCLPVCMQGVVVLSEQCINASLFRISLNALPLQ